MALPVLFLWEINLHKNNIAMLFLWRDPTHLHTNTYTPATPIYYFDQSKHAISKQNGRRSLIHTQTRSVSVWCTPSFISPLIYIHIITYHAISDTPRSYAHYFAIYIYIHKSYILILY